MNKKSLGLGESVFIILALSVCVSFAFYFIQTRQTNEKIDARVQEKFAEYDIHKKPLSNFELSESQNASNGSSHSKSESTSVSFTEATSNSNGSNVSSSKGESVVDANH